MFCGTNDVSKSILKYDSTFRLNVGYIWENLWNIVGPTEHDYGSK